ncbi:hypothetical protein ACWGSA_08920 [Streptomyces diastaticus]
MAGTGIGTSQETPRILTVDAVPETDAHITMGRGDTSPALPGKRYQRDTDKRCVNRLKQQRDIATRYEKTTRSTWPDSTTPAPSSGPPDDTQKIAQPQVSGSRPR